jgi:hypothetical protein
MQEQAKGMSMEGRVFVNRPRAEHVLGKAMLPRPGDDVILVTGLITLIGRGVAGGSSSCAALWMESRQQNIR